MRRTFPLGFALLFLLSFATRVAPLRADAAGDGTSAADTSALDGDAPGLNPPPKIVPAKTRGIILHFRKENGNGYQAQFLAGEELTYDLLIDARMRAQGTLSVSADRDDISLQVPAQIVPDNVRIVADGMTGDYFGTDVVNTGDLSGGTQPLDIDVNVTLTPKK